MVKAPEFVKALWLLLLGLWLGMEVGIDFIAAPTLFITLKGNTVLAATLAGNFFYALNIAGLAILVLLLASAAIMHRDTMFSKAPMILLLLCLVFILIELFFVTPQIHELRSQLGALYGSTSAAPKDDPMRVRFDMMHHISVMRAMAQLCMGIVAFLIAAKRMKA